MLSCQFTDQISGNLGGVPEGFSEYIGKLWNHVLGILFMYGQSGMAGTQMRCNLFCRICLVIGFFFHADGKASDLTSTQRLHQCHTGT